MTVFTDEIAIDTRGEDDIIDITEQTQAALTSSGISGGLITLFVPGSTGAITTIEFEPGLKKDFPEMLERIAPSNIEYEHEKRWHDGNGRSHVKASLLKPDLSVPFQNGHLLTGTWQQIVFVELDVRPRKRKIIVQIIGE